MHFKQINNFFQRVPKLLKEIRVPSARCCCVQSVSTEKPRHPRHAQAGGRHEVTEGKKGCTEAAPWFASKLGANLSLLLNKSVFPMFA